MEQQSFIFDSVMLKPKQQIGLHQQSDWELTCVIKGAGIRLLADSSEPFSSGDVVLVPPDMPHCWYFNDDVTNSQGYIHNLTVRFSSEQLSRCATTFTEFSSQIDTILSMKDRAISFYGNKAKAIIRLLKHMQRQEKPEQVVSFLQLLLLIASDKEQNIVSRYHKISREEERMNNVKIYIACNLHHNITLKDVAQYAGMNRSAFCVFFKRNMGMTFIDYLNRMRVNHVCHLLQKDKMPVAEACYKSGFNDVPYFNRLFKRMKGMSPTQWIRKTQQPSTESAFKS